MSGLYLNVLKTEKTLQFWAKYSQRAWHVIPAQEVNHLRWQLIADQTERVTKPYTIIRLLFEFIGISIKIIDK